MLATMHINMKVTAKADAAKDGELHG